MTRGSQKCAIFHLQCTMSNEAEIWWRGKTTLWSLRVSSRTAADKLLGVVKVGVARVGPQLKCGREGGGGGFHATGTLPATVLLERTDMRNDGAILHSKWTADLLERTDTRNEWAILHSESWTYRYHHQRMVFAMWCYWYSQFVYTIWELSTSSSRSLARCRF